MNSIVVERLQELSRLKERVDTDLEAAELLSLTGAAIGPRYPKLLNAKEILDKTIPELEAVLGEVEINSLAEGEAQALRTEGSGVEEVEKRLNEIIPETTLSDLRSLETSGVLTSPNAEALAAQSEFDIQTEMSPKVQAAADSFEKVFRTSAHPSFGAYGMVPDDRTRQVWRNTPIAGGERGE